MNRKRLTETEKRKVAEEYADEFGLRIISHEILKETYEEGLHLKRSNHELKRKMTKRNILIGALFIALLIAGVIYEAQQKKLNDLQEDLRETQEQLLISNDQLKQIEARNEAIKYIEEAEAE